MLPSASMLAIMATLAFFAPLELPALKTSSQDRPVTKVVKLLQGMKATMEKEAESEADLMEKFNCWCKENGENKAESVEKDQARVKEMQSRIEELTATSARLKTEYTNLAQDVAKGEESMDQQMALRREQKEKFDGENLQLSKDLDSLQHARATLDQGTGLLQVTDQQALGSLVKDMIERHSEKFNEDEMKDMSAFMQQDPTSVDSIQGTFQGLESKFTSSLKELRDEEARNKATFEKLIEAKRTEISTGKAQVASKKEQKTSADEERVHLKRDVKDTEASIASDTAFAAEVKEKCATKGKSWDQRQKTRAEELEAVQKAIQILDADDAHEVFSKTMNPSLLQINSKEEHARRKKALEILSHAGQKLDQRLVTLAVEAKLDGFTRVKEKIDLMVSALKKEQADEVEKKDYCTEEFQKNKLAISAKTREGEGLGAQTDVLKTKLGDTTEELQNLREQIEEMKKQQKLAAQNREKENAEFQKVVTEQRQTQTLLRQASVVLGSVYNKKDDSFVQFQEIPKEPETFGSHQASSSSNGVMLMLQQLEAEAKEMETESVAAERESQADYEAFGKDIAADIVSKNKVLTDRVDEKAEAEGTLVETKTSKKEVSVQIEQLENTKLQLHDTCDFTMQNFDVRQKARVDEIEALREAKSMLSGAML